MRSSILLLALLTVACGDAGPTGPNPPPPPPPPPPSVTVPDQTVGSAGGAVLVSLPDSPIDGMKITVPAGAFPAAQTVGISYASNAGFPHPSGSTLISPLITIRTSNGGFASRPMLITIPVTVPTGSFPQIVLRDPATGRRRALPTVEYTSTSVTAMTGHFNGSRLMGSDGSFAASMAGASITGASLRDPAATGELAVVALPLEQLSLDHDTHFRPGVDSWEFRSSESVLEDDFSVGAAATAAWYFIAQKDEHGSLWKKFQEVDGVEASNRRGLRWASVAESAIYHRLTDDVQSVIDALIGLGRGSSAVIKQRLAVASFHAMRAALTSSPDEPQLLLLLGATDGAAGVLVYRSTGQKLFAVDPDNPGATLTIDFSSGSMAPVTTASGAYTTIVAPGVSILEDEGDLPSQWSEVEDGTIGDDEFPIYRPMVAWGPAADERTELKGGVVYAFDANSPVVWMDCLTCIGDTRVAAIPPGTEKVSLMEVYTKKGTAPWTGPDGTFVLSTTTATIGDIKVGAFLGTHRTAGESHFYWLDWFAFTSRRLAASIAPASPTGAGGTDIELTLSITGAPGNLEYVWDFADGPLVTTSTLTATHTWATAGTYAVKATARDKTTKQPVARASVSVVVTQPLQAWKFTSMTATFSTVGNPGTDYDARWRADSSILKRIAVGETQGGFRLVDQAFTPTGFPPRTAPAGIYLLEGASLTLANLLDPATSNTFSVATFPNASLVIPAAPQVSGWNLVQESAPANPLCNVYTDSYVRTGTLGNGHVTGFRVPLCVQSIILPSINGARLMSMDVDVSFLGGAASGTISVIYYFYGAGLANQESQRIARLTFTATRLTQ